MTESLQPDSSAATVSLASQPQDAPVGLPAGDGRWSVWHAFVFSWVLPATSTRRLLHVGLAKAFSVHLLSGLLLFFGVTALVPLIQGDSPFELWGRVITEVARWPAEFLAGLGIAVLVVESLAVGLTLLSMPWGARDEKLRSSLYHAMRTVWLQSITFTVATVLLVVFVAAWDKFLLRPWYVYSYNWSDRPWYLRHSDEIWGYAAFLAYTWVFWALLRAVGSRAVVAPVDAPPTCQACGYNLTGSAAEGFCPECGKSVHASLGPDARPGILWEQRLGMPWRPAWWRTSRQAIREPEQFGRQMQVYSPPAAHRRFMNLHMLVGGLIGVVGSVFWLAGMITIGRLGTYGFFLDDFLWLTAPVAGISTGLAILAISLLAAGVMGLLFSLGSGRNHMPVAMRCAAYLSGFVTLWAAANAPPAFIFGLSSAIDLLDVIGAQMRMDDEEVFLWAWFAFNLVWLYVYARRLQAMLQGARYATR